MKQGRTLVELAQEVQRQAQAKRDFLSDTREISVLGSKEGGVTLHMPEYGEFSIRDLGHTQIASHTQVPGPFYRRLLSTHPDLLAHNLNELFHREPETRMVRTLDGQVRAFLSNRYQRRDNDELLEHILPVIGQIPDVQFPSTEVTENRLYIKFVTPRITGEVKRGDVVCFGGVITNSEVGQGSLSVQPMIYRLVCLNGMIAGDGIRKWHVGRQVDSETARELFRDDTLRADDHAFWMKVTDVVQACVTEVNFQRLLAKMQDAANSQPMANPSAGVQELSQRFSLSDREEESVLHHLITGGDLSRWGALNAVTAVANDVDDYDRATELQEIGGAILAMGERDWVTIGTNPNGSTRRRARRQTPELTAEELIAAI